MFSELTAHCGINAWLSNSVVQHAVSDTPAGVYSVVREALPPAHGVFSHEPTLAGPAPDGRFAMYYTHNDGVVTKCPPCNCSSPPAGAALGNSTPNCPADWDADGRDPRKRLQTYMASTADFATWSAPVPVPQLDVYDDTAFSGAILRNGSLVAMTRTQVVWSDRWDDVASYTVVASFKANHYGEGAHLWVDEDRGVVHMLSHDGNMLGTTCGKHYSAALGKLTDWTTQGCAYQAKGVRFADGTTRSFGRRERPHVVLNGTRPVALSTAVTPVPTACVGKPRCLYRFPDASHTLLQAVR